MSTRRSQLVLVAFVVLALLGVAAIAVPASPLHKEATLGLDLQGGLEVILEAQPPDDGTELKKEDVDRSLEIIRNRIDKLGVSEPEVRKQGENQISVQLAGVFDTQRAKDIIGKTAKLELYKLQDNLVRSVSIDSDQNMLANTSLYNLLANGTVQGKVRKDGAEEWYLFDKSKRPVAGPEQNRADLFKGREGGEKVPPGFRVLAVPKDTAAISCSETAVVCPGVNESPPTRTYWYLFNAERDEDGPPEMTGEDLKLSGTRQDFDPQSSGPIVLMQFTDSGEDKFHDITRELAQDGRFRAGFTGGDDQSAFQNFAIVLDDEIQSFPYIDFNENPDGIPGGNGAQISGLDSLNEAKDLALVLQTGALPIEFQTVQSTDVSATLGKDSLKQAQRAAIAGLLVVALFLLLFYRFLGLVAVLGLAIYAALLYATLLLFGVTLTLPGFAGMILTIGVAADANVVIFERIKEEARTGKSVRAAIAAGYQKGFSTIIDANVVTAITALVLFAVATAGVKGFALMLLLGTAISLLTAVGATRAFLGLLAGFRWFDSPRFMGASGTTTAKWLKIDYMGKRNIWFAISGTIVAIGVVSLAIQGLNFGIDFKGGTQMTFQTPQATSIDDVRAEADAIGRGNAVIQGRGKAENENYRSFSLKTESLTPAEISELRTGLQESLQITKPGVRNVSESFGRQIAASAILAIVVSLLLIFAYIAFRFQLKFAIPVMIALLHDMLVTIGVYSFTGREVTTSTVAAVLTILGYSLYDTIIIFDRVRENLPLMRRHSFRQIANVSIQETITRSLATTFITLLPVGALLFFGGDTLKDFAFALMVGIASGAYSTIFIASPLLTIFKEREPEYARKKAEYDGDGSEEPDADGTPARRRPILPKGGPALPADPVALEQATEVSGSEAPAPVGGLTPQPAASGGDGSAQAKRERRRQRRRARPHGRSR